MALITDPDNLHQGTVNAVADLRFGVDTTASGRQISLDSAGSNLPTVADNDYIHVRGADDTENNGLYIVNDATPVATAIVVDKVSGANPVNATGADNVNGEVMGDTTSKCSVAIIPSTREIYLPEQNLLSTDGVTLQALYSFLKEEWKDDPDLIAHPFPMIAVTPEQFEFIENWVPADSTLDTPNIQSTKLIRTGGWSEIDDASNLIKQWAGVVTLGSFEDETPVTGDLAYYSFGTDATVNNSVDFTFTGPVNEAVQTFEEIGNPDTWTLVDGGGGADTATRATGSFITDGFVVGGQVTIRASTTPANDGTYTLTGVAALTLTVATGSWDTAGADTAAQVAVDNRNAMDVRLRVRDADPNGKLYDNSDLVAIGLTALSNKTERFPLANATDLKIAETDANIDGNTPYTQMAIRYFDQAFNREVDSATNRDFGIVIDVGTHSGVDGSFTAAGSVLTTTEGGITGANYTGGTLRIHEGSDENTIFTISGTPTATTVTITTTFTATESNISFTLQRATPVTATIEEIYEYVQRQLRQTTDIDSTDQTVIGRTADDLLTFVGDALTCGSVSSPPSNPNGGGTGVIIEGFDSNDTNDLTFVDNTNTAYSFPFVAAGTISFNNNLQNDTGPAEYFMFFTYTTRNNAADGAVTAASGATMTLTGAATLPVVADQDYLDIQGFTNAVNNGVYQVTDAAPTTSAIDLTKYDSSVTLVNESATAITIDENPVDSPAAILVDNNSGTDITGTIGGPSVGFDFDYDNNVQGGRTASTDAVVTLRAQGTDVAQYVETSGTITQATGLTFSLVAGLERNYSNPA
jgi:hypothetical protein